MGAFRDVVLLWSRSLSVIKLYHAQSAKGNCKLYSLVLRCIGFEQRADSY